MSELKPSKAIICACRVDLWRCALAAQSCNISGDLRVRRGDFRHSFASNTCWNYQPYLLQMGTDSALYHKLIIVANPMLLTILTVDNSTQHQHVSAAQIRQTCKQCRG